MHIINLPEDDPNKGSAARVVQRQGQIAQYVLDHGSANIKELADLFGVSLITAHRDLDELERQGFLRKLRGYVTAQPSGLFDSNVRYRLRTATAEKDALARFALTQIEPGQSVMLDESTTSLAIARLLHRKAPLHVTTNFAMVLNELNEVKGIDLVSLGGEYLPALAAFSGEVCLASLAAVRSDVLFVSTSAVSRCVALHQDERIMRGKRAMMDSADFRVLLVDHTKFGKTAFYKLAPLQDFDLVVVDSNIEEDHLDELRGCSVPVEIAPI
ncbi:DeoR/GlpR family DNA-binding transcription regulator [soil metagenome]